MSKKEQLKDEIRKRLPVWLGDDLITNEGPERDGKVIDYRATAIFADGHVLAFWLYSNYLFGGQLTERGWVLITPDGVIVDRLEMASEDCIIKNGSSRVAWLSELRKAHGRLTPLSNKETNKQLWCVSEIS